MTFDATCWTTSVCCKVLIENLNLAKTRPSTQKRVSRSSHNCQDQALPRYVYSDVRVESFIKPRLRPLNQTQFSVQPCWVPSVVLACLINNWTNTCDKSRSQSIAVRVLPACSLCLLASYHSRHSSATPSVRQCDTMISCG